MKLREFGQTGLYLSPITFGSMRLDSQKISFDDAVNLVSYLCDNGVTSFHSSHEYPTDEFFCQVIRELQRIKPDVKLQHVAKIGVPHFDEKSFEGDKLIDLIDRRLQDLNADKIDVVQWLVRQQPNNDVHRLAILQQCQSELQQVWDKLQQAGKVGVLASFPYSFSFAEAVLNSDRVSGLVTYLNPLELEMVSLLDEMSARGQGYIAIRPFSGGLFTVKNLLAQNQEASKAQQLKQLLQQLQIPVSEANDFAVQFPLLHPAVTSVMLSVTSIEHAQIAIAAAHKAVINRDLFEQIVNQLRSNEPLAHKH